MKVDKQTLENLDVFPADSGNETKNCLFEIFNQTKTLGGESKLKKIFQNGLENIDSIKDMQLSLKYILSNYDRLSLFEDFFYESEYNKISSYLRINITKLNLKKSPLSYVRAFFWRKTSHGLFDRLKAGMNKMLNFIFYLNNFIVNFDNKNLPDRLYRIINKLESFLDNDEIQFLLNQCNKKFYSSYIILKIDYIVRKNHYEDFLDIFDLLFDLDCLVSMALSVYDNKLCFPLFLDNKEPVVDINDLYHPLIENCVTNNFQLDDLNNLLFITGPNMAGKSVYLKASAIAVFLAHLGLGVPAKNMRLSTFDCLIASMTTVDDITSGYSYFYNEVRRVREIGESLKNGSSQFVLLDEPFKGTNIQDAFEASKRLINLMINKKSALFLFSTHIIELAEGLKLESIKCRHFKAIEKDGVLIYDYNLCDGITDQKLGLKIMEDEKVFDLFEIS